MRDTASVGGPPPTRDLWIAGLCVVGMFLFIRYFCME